MSIEKRAAKIFKMSDDVWERHVNPWSVWTRYPCLPLLALAVWSRAWIGWLSLIAVAVVCVWIWLNPRVFRKPKTTNHWASKAVLGERVLLQHPQAEIPSHHRTAIRHINVVTFVGFFFALYGLVAFDVVSTVFGTIVTILGKTWFLDRMVWLFTDLSATSEEYASWLY